MLCCTKMAQDGTQEMQERYNLTEAAKRLGISRRTLYNWLAEEPPSSQKTPGERRFTRKQLERLAEKHGYALTDDLLDLKAVDAALTERIEALERRVAKLESQVDATSAEDQG